MNFKYISALVLLSFNVAASGNGAGNGGDAIVCPEKVMLLDYYEAISSHVIIKLEGKSIRENVDAVLLQMDRLDPGNAKIVKQFADEIIDGLSIEDSGNKDTNQKVSIVDAELRDIDDSQEVIIPTGCFKKQLVVQVEGVQKSHGVKYYIQKILWQKMDIEQKSLTVLHEAFYQWSLGIGSRDSRFARFLNGQLSSTTAANINPQKYSQILKDSKLLVKQSVSLYNHNVIFEDAAGFDLNHSTHKEIVTYNNFLYDEKGEIHLEAHVYRYFIRYINTLHNGNILNEFFGTTVRFKNGSLKLKFKKTGSGYRRRSVLTVNTILNPKNGDLVFSDKTGHLIKNISFDGRYYKTAEKVVVNKDGYIVSVE